MCVIIYKPENIFIAQETINQAWNVNSDGAGIAYFAPDGDVIVEKGIMQVESLIRRLNQLSDRELVVHLRYKTHGLVNPHQTHPFAIAKNPVDAKAYFSKVPFKAVLFHNGIIEGYGNKETSDTLDFVIRVLAKIPEHETRIEVLHLAYGTFAYLYKGKVELVGEYDKYQGCLYSNLFFLPYKSKKVTRLDEWETGVAWETNRHMEFGEYQNEREQLEDRNRHYDLDEYEWEDDAITARIRKDMRGKYKLHE